MKILLNLLIAITLAVFLILAVEKAASLYVKYWMTVPVEMRRISP